MSQEGMIQGCPLSIAMYALSVVSLIKKCHEVFNSADEPSGLFEVVQVWFADDAVAGGGMRTLCQFWDLLMTHGHSYGYFPNPSKTHLVVKAEQQAAAERFLKGQESSSLRKV